MNNILFAGSMVLRIATLLSILCGNGYYPATVMSIGFATGTAFILTGQGIICVFKLEILIFKNLICCFLSACMLFVPVLLLFYFHTMIINYVWQVMFSLGLDFSTIVVYAGGKCYRRYKNTGDDVQNILVDS